MLILAILNWGVDLLIMPVESIQWVKDKKRRLNLSGVDYIIYDSGYLTPFHLDAWHHELTEQEHVELFGNRAIKSKRKPAWDTEP